MPQKTSRRMKMKMNEQQDRVNTTRRYIPYEKRYLTALVHSSQAFLSLDPRNPWLACPMCRTERPGIQTRARRPRGRHNRQSYARIVHPGHATLWRWFTFCRGKSNGRDGVWGERAESRGPSQPRHDRELRDTPEASRQADRQTHRLACRREVRWHWRRRGKVLGSS